jgi:NTP pyrophosphatase (non-canonical NTP hydrolase)
LSAENEVSFVKSFDEVQRVAHLNAVRKGFWDSVPEVGTSLMLMTSELAEACEAYREGNPPSTKAAGFSCAEEELADVIIRVMDFAEFHHLRISEAILCKMAHNASRPRKHGKEF